MERSGQHWLMDSTQGLSLALNDLLTVQTENLDLIWLPCDQHNNAIFRNALGQMKTTKGTAVIPMALMAVNLENVQRCHVQVSTTNRLSTLSILRYLRTLQSFKHILFRN